VRAQAQASRPEAGAVLGKATIRAADLLGMSSAHLAAVIGVSPASLSRVRAANRAIDPAGKEGELALTFLRMYRSLGALLGDRESCRRWFRAENAHLRGVPAELVRSVEGLVNVAGYLDAMRGKV
jgi:hypothetical protein